MFSFEPPRTAYDVHFHIAGIPVRVHPFFWLATLILGSNSWSANGNADPDAGLKLLIWVGVMFVSILVHELGHSVVMRYFGQTPRIVLHMLGGLAIADTDFLSRRAARRTPQQQILISLAGPGAGFVLAALTAAWVTALGGEFRLDLTDPPFFYRYGLPETTSRAAGDHDRLLAVLQYFLGPCQFAPGAPTRRRTSGPRVAGDERCLARFRAVPQALDHHGHRGRRCRLDVSGRLVHGAVVRLPGRLELHDPPTDHGRWCRRSSVVEGLTTATGAPPQPTRRVVLLGASNVTNGLSTVVATACQAWGSPLDILAAIGHGRSYGATSSVLGRSLPGILQCGLWEDLQQRPPLPTAALVTDIGNDLVYGHDVDVILRWLETCLERLHRLVDRLVITRLPLASIAQTPDWQKRLLISLIFPGSRIDPVQTLVKAHELDRQLVAFASRYRAYVVQPDRAWYGWDPIHISRVSQRSVAKIPVVLVGRRKFFSCTTFAASLVHRSACATSRVEIFRSPASSRTACGDILGRHDVVALLSGRQPPDDPRSSFPSQLTCVPPQPFRRGCEAWHDETRAVHTSCWPMPVFGPPLRDVGEIRWRADCSVFIRIVRQGLGVRQTARIPVFFAITLGVTATDAPRFSTRTIDGGCGGQVSAECARERSVAAIARQRQRTCRCDHRIHAHRHARNTRRIDAAHNAHHHLRHVIATMCVERPARVDMSYRFLSSRVINTHTSALQQSHLLLTSGT